MYQPNYQITDKLLLNISSVDVIVEGLKYLELSYEMRSKLTQQSKAENIFQLAQNFGLNITLRDASRLVEGKELDIDAEQAQLLTNLRNLLEFNRSSVAEGYTVLDLTVLLHLNKIAVGGWKESWEIKIRQEDDDLDVKFDDWVEYRDLNLAAEAVEPELNNLLSWYQQTQDSVHNLVRDLVLVYRLLEISPFVAGNKLTIFGVLDMLLYQHGYLQNNQMALLTLLEVQQGEIFTSWNAVRRSIELTPWLEVFTENFNKYLEETKKQTTELLAQEKEKNAKQPFLDLNQRQLKILRYLQNIPVVKRDDYCEMMDVSTMTAYRDLTDLVHKKLLKIEGQGRGTKYMLANR